MNNKEFLTNYLATATAGEIQSPAKYSRLAYKNNILVNYDTPICYIDTKDKKIFVNVRKYSATTSRIQSLLKFLISQAENLKSYTIKEYQGGNCYYWNGGYVGAKSIKYEDLDRAAFNFQFQKGGFYNEAI